MSDRKSKLIYSVENKLTPKPLEPIDGDEELGVVEERKDLGEIVERAEI